MNTKSVIAHRKVSLPGKILVDIPIRKDLEEIVQNSSLMWNPEIGSYILKDDSQAISKLFDLFKGKIWVDISALKKNSLEKTKSKPSEKLLEDKTLILREYEGLLRRRRYSINTIGTYCSLFSSFLTHFSESNIDDLSDDDIRKYMDRLVRVKRVSSSTQNQVINAIKFYYEKLRGGPRTVYSLDRPRKQKRLPKIISKEQVFKIIGNTSNLKHEIIVSLLYSAGLRMSELLKLRKEDIDFDKDILFVRGGKGNKDRTSILAKDLKPRLKTYFASYKPQYWVIEGLNRKKYSSTSVNNILDKAAKKSGIEQKVTAHVLRHSFATHLLEHGTDIRYIQTLLGHSSTETTMIYTWVSNKNLQKIKSPFDND